MNSKASSTFSSPSGSLIHTHSYNTKILKILVLDKQSWGTTKLNNWICMNVHWTEELATCTLHLQEPLGNRNLCYEALGVHVCGDANARSRAVTEWAEWLLHTVCLSAWQPHSLQLIREYVGGTVATVASWLIARLIGLILSILRVTRINHNKYIIKYIENNMRSAWYCLIVDGFMLFLLEFQHFSKV